MNTKNYSNWLKRIHEEQPIHAREVDGNDAEEIAAFIMQGVIDNDRINNNQEPAVWSDADDAVQVYVSNNWSQDPDGNDIAITWGADMIAEAAIHVEALMRINGNLE